MASRPNFKLLIIFLPVIHLQNVSNINSEIENCLLSEVLTLTKSQTQFYDRNYNLKKIMANVLSSLKSLNIMKLRFEGPSFITSEIMYCGGQSSLSIEREKLNPTVNAVYQNVLLIKHGPNALLYEGMSFISADNLLKKYQTLYGDDNGK